MSKLITKDYQGMSFTFREDGYFNMTKAAAHFGKQLQHFWNSPDTRNYCFALSEMVGIKTSESDDLSYGLAIAKRGNGGGTFAHPKLAVFFARWLDVRFAVWCDAIIEDILTNKAELTITQPATSATVQVSNQMQPEFMVATDALARYDNGYGHCFACLAYFPGDEESQTPRKGEISAVAHTVK